jgi:N-methylhydantoinase B
MLDRIAVSILQLCLESIVREMGEAMLRAAYSQILSSSHGFSTAGRGGHALWRANL